ncbi:hypothetical protein BHE74_00032545 [Ensete ventricosum]|nr:hypothetical protein BHE74_00032545 [Ensete ventricosum]
MRCLQKADRVATVAVELERPEMRNVAHAIAPRRSDVRRCRHSVRSCVRLTPARQRWGVDLTCVRSVVRPLTPHTCVRPASPCRVGHIGGPVVRGREDVAARSTSAISFFPPPGKTFSRCPIRVLKMRSCVEPPVCGDVGLALIGFGREDELEHKSWGSGREDELEHKSWEFNREDELGHKSWGSGREGELGHKSWGSGRETNSGTNPGDLAERANSGTNPGDLAERVNSGTNPGDLAERANSGTNPGDLAKRVNSGSNPGDLAERTNSGSNLGDLAERMKRRSSRGDFSTLNWRGSSTRSPRRSCWPEPPRKWFW